MAQHSPFYPMPVVSENAIQRRTALSFHRYGHPDGPVYLHTDCGMSVGQYPSWWDVDNYTPTWERFTSLWLKNISIHPLVIQKLTLTDSPSKIEVHFNDIADPLSTEPRIGQSEVEGFAAVICVPPLTADVAFCLKRNGYNITPIAMMPFESLPPPFECDDTAMIIRLGLPQAPVFQGVWLVGTDDQPAAPGQVLMDTVLLHVDDVHGTPTIVSFTSIWGFAVSMKMTLENRYWKPRFQDLEHRDLSRCLPLPFLWYAVRRWDETSEAIDTFIGSWEFGYNPRAAQRLHVLRTHLFNCQILLTNFESIITELKAGTEDKIVIDECKKLLSECNRLDSRRKMHEERTKHIIDIIYSQSNTMAAEASARTAEASARAAEASVRDSRDMKQISRLTMLFLPASVMAGIFGIDSSLFNAQNSLIIYIGVTVPLTLVVIWVFVAMQVEHYFDNFPPGIWRRALWPFYTFRRHTAKTEVIPMEPWHNGCPMSV